MVADTDLAPRGVIPPLVSPLDEHGDVDRRSLERLVEFQLAAGVDGVFVCGSTGEVALLDTVQRKEIIEVTAGAVAGAVPVLAGAVDTGTRRVAEHVAQASAAGADAVVVTAPFYVRPHPGETVAHFRYVQAASDVPVIAYDIPSAVGTALTPDIVTELAESKTVVALKDSSGDLTSFREILRRTGLPALTGSELLADTAMGLGAAGLVPGLGNVDPHGYVRLYRAALAGDVETARSEQDRLAKLFTIIGVADLGRIGFTAGALGAFKAAMALRGIIDTPLSNRPLGALTAEETLAVGEILESVGLGAVGVPGD
ncbi:dihydrodipicolinate synthase family protein [Prauserella marina]|uniref:4-hydroxy-tetrahydrodipicolinate synthase n=1 Tax=Prauserella marina TaxID=530584 RepID=A0A222VMF0_9PSEU|nr:dihydrodipicolinate synthase family protein [Prauserella marina]ASR35064.1 dihydrodipicolinate synthase family protein [Prauserella marina]PWV85192.1 4-hydroxy-tetrahydrodipicolinate synthase [Prauserella marina]SDC02685.1 4-hydroxy-tetrahydrodipicolinate synthase [Prauserella marina]